MNVTLDANGVGTLELPTAGFDLIYLSGLGTAPVSISAITLKPGTPTAKTTYGYDPVGQLTNAQFPNGTSRTVTYDRAGRISTLAVDPLAAWSYTRDANGNPTRIDAQGIGLYGNRTFTYDPANR